MHPSRLATVLVWVLALGVVGAAPASASCATNSPQPSPNAFVGTVIATSEGGHVAEVVTDEGATVTVRGTGHTRWFANSRSSVDRRYALGGRYEFHPVNDESPYSDNVCTATRQISGPPLSAFLEPSSHEGFLPAWLPVDEQSGPVGYLVFFGPLTVGALALFAVSRRLVRRRRTSSSAA